MCFSKSYCSDKIQHTVPPTIRQIFQFFRTAEAIVRRTLFGSMEAFGEIVQTRLAFDGVVTDRRSSHLLECKGRNWNQGKEGNPLHDGDDLRKTVLSFVDDLQR